MAIPEPIIIRSFAGGELSPALSARADIAKFTIGLRNCRNFLVQRHGGIANRPGTRFIAECKTTDPDVRLARYVSEIPDESVLIEIGEQYLRFYQQGALVEYGVVAAYNGATDYLPGDSVTSGGTIYLCIKATTGNAPPNATYWYAQPGGIVEVPTPYLNPFQVHWVQSGRIITFTHQDHKPRDLVFRGLTAWALIELDTAPKVDAPVNLVLTAGAGARSFGYIVTAAHPLTYEESQPSAQVINAACAPATDVAPHVLTWDPVLTPPITGDVSPEYYVYCDPWGNGTYGFIGTATGAATFNNPGFTPDFGITPPLPRDLFPTSDDYPQTCAYHQQRRYLANTVNSPDGVQASRVGFLDNFGISSPLQDDDAISFRISGNNHHPVRRLVALKNLLIMTDGGEWRLVGAGGVIAPNTLDLEQETYVGLDPDLRPVIIGNSIIYVQARGSIIRELRFDQDVEGLAGKDLTIFAAHLFDGRTVEGMDYQQTPNSIVWVVRSDGVLLGLTYLHEQDIWGWHRHDTGEGDSFIDVCTVPEPGEDATYFIVRRTIGGVSRRYIEKLERREIIDFNEDSFFVDSGLSYSGAPVVNVSGLDHLAGRTVAVNADGTHRGTVVVGGGGSITIPGAAASDIHVGLPIVADAESLELDIAGTSIRDKKKRVQAIRVIVDESSREFQAGPSSDKLRRYTAPTYDNPSDPSHTGTVELSLTAAFNDNGRVFIRHDRATPLTILGLIPLVELGG